MPKEPKLRGRSKQRSSPYPLGEIPHSLAVSIGQRLVHRLAVGASDITGDDFGEIFAQSIKGEHRAKPLGLADVNWEGCAWSVKTIKANNPFTATTLPFISGRNDVNFSFDIKNPYEDIAATGAGVLKIWNKRIDEALSEFEELRIFEMVRNMTTLEFTLVEIEAARFVPSEYHWTLSKNKNNLWGYDREHNIKRFTFQPGGKQFTIHRATPSSAYRFRITKRPGIIEQRHVLSLIKFEDSWIEAVTIDPPLNSVPLQGDADAQDE